MLSPRAYTKAIDMWSVGCILGEMLGNKVMFPGRDYVKQIELIMQQMPAPTADDVQSFQCERARSYITKLQVASSPCTCRVCLGLGLLDVCVCVCVCARCTHTRHSYCRARTHAIRIPERGQCACLG